MLAKPSRAASTIPSRFHGTWEADRELTNRNNMATLDPEYVSPLEYDIRITFTQDNIEIQVDGNPIPHSVQLLDVSAYSLLVELRHQEADFLHILHILYTLPEVNSLRRVIIQANLDNTRYFPLPVCLYATDH